MNKEQLNSFSDHTVTVVPPGTPIDREAYAHARVVHNRKIGIQPYLTTVGVVVDINTESYAYRYCFKNHSDAVVALNEWDGVDPLPGPWIKVKGAHRGRLLDHKRGDLHFEAMCHEWRLQSRHVRINVGNGLLYRMEVWAVRVEPDEGKLFIIYGCGGLALMLDPKKFNEQVILES
jgi:hypothetical protein